MPRCACKLGGTCERVVGVAFGLLRLTLRDRHPGARGQRHHQEPAGRCRDGVVGPAAGRDQIPARQRGLRIDRRACRRRHRGQDTRGAARPPRSRPAPLAASPAARAAIANADVGRCPRRARRARRRPRWPRRRRPGPHPSHPGTPARWPWPARLSRLIDPIVSGLGLGGQLGELCDGSGQIALQHLCHSEAQAALARVEPVTDRVGEVASFFGGRARRDRVTRRERRDCACQARIWLSLHRSSNARARSIASAKYARATSAL